MLISLKLLNLVKTTETSSSETDQITDQDINDLALVVLDENIWGNVLYNKQVKLFNNNDHLLFDENIPKLQLPENNQVQFNPSNNTISLHNFDNAQFLYYNHNFGNLEKAVDKILLLQTPDYPIHLYDFFVNVQSDSDRKYELMNEIKLRISNIKEEKTRALSLQDNLKEYRKIMKNIYFKETYLKGKIGSLLVSTNFAETTYSDYLIDIDFIFCLNKQLQAEIFKRMDKIIKVEAMHGDLLRKQQILHQKGATLLNLERQKKLKIINKIRIGAYIEKIKKLLNDETNFSLSTYWSNVSTIKQRLQAIDKLRYD